MKFRDDHGGPGGPADAGSSGRGGGWADDQLLRLENEWRRLQRNFAYHPHVRIIPLHGDPPDQYQVEYRLRTLIMPEGGTLEYAPSAAVHMVAAEFPARAAAGEADLGDFSSECRARR